PGRGTTDGDRRARSRHHLRDAVLQHEGNAHPRRVMLYFDCFSGASGDMVLGALLDLGLPLDALKSALGSLAIEYGEVTAERVSRRPRRRFIRSPSSACIFTKSGRSTPSWTSSARSTDSSGSGSTTSRRRR